MPRCPYFALAGTNGQHGIDCRSAALSLFFAGTRKKGHTTFASPDCRHAVLSLFFCVQVYSIPKSYTFAKISGNHPPKSKQELYTKHLTSTNIIYAITPHTPKKQNGTSILKTIPYLRYLKQSSPDKQNPNSIICRASLFSTWESQDVVKGHLLTVFSRFRDASPTNIGIPL